jgi:hypothetical protein
MYCAELKQTYPPKRMDTTVTGTTPQSCFSRLILLMRLADAKHCNGSGTFRGTELSKVAKARDWVYIVDLARNGKVHGAGDPEVTDGKGVRITVHEQSAYRKLRLKGVNGIVEKWHPGKMCKRSQERSSPFFRSTQELATAKHVAQQQRKNGSAQSKQRALKAAQRTTMTRKDEDLISQLQAAGDNRQRRYKAGDERHLSHLQLPPNFKASLKTLCTTLEDTALKLVDSNSSDPLLTQIYHAMGMSARVTPEFVLCFLLVRQNGCKGIAHFIQTMKELEAKQRGPRRRSEHKDPAKRKMVKGPWLAPPTLYCKEAPDDLGVLHTFFPPTPSK